MEKKEKILVVDDRIENLILLSSVLEENNFDVLEAENGETALFYANTKEVSLILLDIMMPGMDGFEVCEKLKENEKTASIPIIIISALGDHENKYKGFEYGAVDYVTKPFNQDELLARVKTHVDLRRSRLALIDQLKRTEKAEKEKSYLASILESTEDFACIKDLSLNIISANKALIKASGKKSLSELKGKTDREALENLYNSTLIDKYMDDERKVQNFKQGEFLLDEEDFITPSGEVIKTLAKKFPVFNDNGELIGTANISRDITQLKENEEELEKHRNHLEELVKQRTSELEKTNQKLEAEIEARNIAEQKSEKAQELLNETQRLARIGGWEYNVEDKSVLWTDEVYELTENTKEFKPSLENSWDFLSTENKEHLLSTINMLTEGIKDNSTFLEFECCNYSGKKWWARFFVKAVFSNNKLIRISGTIQDITLHKHAELKIEQQYYEIARQKEKIISTNKALIASSEQLKLAYDKLYENESRYRSIMDSMTEGVYIASEDCDILYTNPAMQKLIGNEKEGAKCYEAFYGFNKKCEWCNSIEELKKSNRSIEVVNKKNGRTYQINNTPLYHANQKISKLAVYNDITDLKNTQARLKESQEKLQKINEYLEERIKEEVAHSREKDRIMALHSRQAAMGEMIGNIAHQWRQPLNTIGLMVQDLEDAHKYNELNEEYLRNNVSELMDLIQYMSQTIDDFRNFFKPSKEKQCFCIEKVLRKAVTLVLAGFKNNNIDLSLEIDSPVEIFGYPNEFSQVVFNILNNAKDAILQQKVKVGSVSIMSFKDDDGFYKILIEDNGGGVSNNIMNRIFDPYFTTKVQSQGTGIGLYMSKLIIEKNMNGLLTVSNSDDGACFKIAVPYKNCPPSN